MAGFLQKAFPKEVLKKTCFVDNPWNSAENLKPVAVFVSKGKQNRVNRIFLFFLSLVFTSTFLERMTFSLLKDRRSCFPYFLYY